MTARSPRPLTASRVGAAALWWLLGAVFVVLPPMVLARSYSDEESEAVAVLFGVGFAILTAAAALVAFFTSGRHAVAVPIAAALSLVGALGGAAVAGGVGLGLGWAAGVAVTVAIMRRMGDPS